MQTIDRFTYVQAAHLFYSEHHTGQFSEGYAKLCSLKYQPSPLDKGWRSLDYEAKEVYKALCKKNMEPFTYDSVQYLWEQATEEFKDYEDDDVIDAILESYGDKSIEESGLINYDQSDWINLDECSTYDLIQRYDRYESDILDWIDKACDEFGCQQRLQLCESETIDDPDDLKTSFTNHAMTHAARHVLYVCRQMQETIEDEA